MCTTRSVAVYLSGGGKFLHKYSLSEANDNHNYYNPWNVCSIRAPTSTNEIASIIVLLTYKTELRIWDSWHTDDVTGCGGNY